MSTEVKLLVAGNPLGEKTWGPEEDAAYMSSLYVNTKNLHDQMSIELRRNQNGAVYSYFMVTQKGFIGANNRPNCFLSVGVKMNFMYTSPLIIFDIIRIAISRCLYGKIYNSSNKYLVEDFDNSVFGEAERCIVDLLNLAIVPDRIVTPLILSQGKSGAMVSYNPLDVTDNKLLQGLKSANKVLISEAVMPEVMKESERKGSEAIKKAAECNGLIAKMKEDAGTMHNANMQLNQKIERLERELERQKGVREIPALVATLRDPLTKLAGYLRVGDSDISNTGNRPPVFKNDKVRSGDNVSDIAGHESGHKDKLRINQTVLSFFSLLGIVVGIILIFFVLYKVSALSSQVEKHSKAAMSQPVAVADNVTAVSEDGGDVADWPKGKRDASEIDIEGTVPFEAGKSLTVKLTPAALSKYALTEGDVINFVVKDNLGVVTPLPAQSASVTFKPEASGKEVSIGCERNGKILIVRYVQIL